MMLGRSVSRSASERDCLIDLIERAARHQLHGVERLARGPAAGLVDGHDRRMLQARRDQRLADEAARRLGAAGDELLDRDRAAEAAVVRAEDAAEAAARELVAHVVAIDGHQRQHRSHHLGDGGGGGGVIGQLGERRSADD